MIDGLDGPTDTEPDAVPDAVDALVVGAGPAGSATAVLLARAGWRVALVERQRFPRRKVCGECIAASNLPLLHALGIGAAFDAAAGAPLRRVTLRRGDDAVTADLPAAADPRHRFGRALGRETLDTLLRDAARAAGATVLQPWSLQALDGGPAGWEGVLRPVGTVATRRLRAALVVDAHGSWDALPCDRPHRSAIHRPSDLLAFKAVFRGGALPAGEILLLALDGGYGGAVVGDGGLTTLAGCLRRDRLDAVRHASPGLRAGDAVEAFLRRSCPGLRQALDGARRDGAWLAAGPLATGIRIDPRDRVFRVGNAAGEAHPILGEGLSMALQSAALLVDRLLADGARVPDAAAQAALQRRYAAAWRLRFAPRLHLAAAFAHAAMRPTASGPLMALARRWPGLLTHGARWGGKVRAARPIGPSALHADPPS